MLTLIQYDPIDHSLIWEFKNHYKIKDTPYKLKYDR